MKHLNFNRIVLSGVALAGVAVLSACATKAPPPPPPPPKPIVLIPPRPMPPMGAAPGLVVPPVGPTGVRQTVNAGLSTAQTTWNFRSAYNVAALNCLKPQHAQIVVNYRKFLKDNQRKLTATNRSVDSEFKARHGSAFIRPREAYMTQVYNYFALPMTLDAFCNAALTVSAEGTTVKSADLDAFAQRGLLAFEQVFEGFFRQYESYRLALADWESRYGAAAYSTTGTMAPASVPGAVTTAPAPSLTLPPVRSPAVNPPAGVVGPVITK